MHLVDLTTQRDADFMKVAEDVRLLSEDPKALTSARSAVGAAIVRNGAVISSSANVILEPIKSNAPGVCHEMSDNDRYNFIEHAERSALFKAASQGADLRNADLYCTRFPCRDCARAIVWFGIRRVIVAEGIDTDSPWGASQLGAKRIFECAGVTLEVMNSHGGRSSDVR